MEGRGGEERKGAERGGEGERGSCLPEMSGQVSTMLSMSTLWIDWVL